MTASLVARVEASASACAWTQLGSVGMSSASGARTRHSVSPEDALLIASIASVSDARLRDEARDWFVTFDDLISRPALKHRVGLLDELGLGRWLEFATPLDVWVRGRLPGVESAASRFRPSGKSLRAITSEAPYGLLRCRAAFGTQARADVLFVLASGPDDARGWMVDAIARTAGYAKSAVREALDRFVEAGIVRRTRVGNADWFTLAQQDRVLALMGDVASPPVDGSRIPRIFSCLIEVARLLDADPDPVLFVRGRAMLGSLDRELGDLRAVLPTPTHELDRGRRELEKFVADLAARLGDATRPLWPW